MLNGDVVDSLDTLKIPKAAWSYAEKIVEATDALCLEHLDEEYADLCRRTVAKLARKRPTPLTRGDLRIWASGVVHAVGHVNFLFDPQQSPHMKADELSRLLDVKKSTMANKAKLVRDLLKMEHFDTEFSRREMIEKSPMTWLLEVEGMVVDARQLPFELQSLAFERGLIPYVPAAAGSEDG